MLSNIRTPDKSITIWNNGRLEIKPLTLPEVYVYEKVRTYSDYTKTSTSILEVKEHVQRLFNSAKIIGIGISYYPEDILKACEKVTRANGGGDLLLSIVAGSENVWITCEKITSQKHKLWTAIFSSSMRGYPQYEMQAQCNLNYDRFKDSIRTEKKVWGVDEVLIQDNGGYITGGFESNIFIVKSGYLFTPPDDGSILPGITRKIVYNIFNNVDFKGFMLRHKIASEIPKMVLEKRLTRADILTADEVFTCSTASGIRPITQVGEVTISDGAGMFTKVIQQAYQETVRNKAKYGISLEKV